MLRREKLLSYLQEKMVNGQVAFAENQRPDQIGEEKPVVINRTADGMLRFKVTPHLRHWNDGKGGYYG
jgi:hypothetical protein